MLRLDKQAELDQLSGSTSEKAERMKRARKENRARCSLYKNWLDHYKRSEGDTERRAFWNFLASNYNDFGELRKLRPGKRSVRKAKKLYRHIALQTHEDKLPECAKTTAGIPDMMRDILGKTEYVKNCIEVPHECEDGAL